MTNKNPSEWRVSSYQSAGSTFYVVYRVRDINDIDHSGNRETCGCWYYTRGEAERFAENLNEEGK